MAPGFVMVNLMIVNYSRLAKLQWFGKYTAVDHAVY